MSAEEVSSARGVIDPPRVSVVGIGNAGTNLLGEAIEIGISPSHCVAVNTDSSQLSKSLARNKVLLDHDLMTNLPEKRVGLTKSLQQSAHRVTPYTQDSDFTILIAGFGGETGTMTAPVVAQYSRTKVRPVVSVVAIPFIHERERRFVAMRGLRRMAESCDCTIVVDNAIGSTFASSRGMHADETVSLAVRTLTELVSRLEPSQSKEMLRIMSLGPFATICSSRLMLRENIQSAILDALESPSAGLPLEKTKGIVLLQRGPSAIGDGQAARAYEAVVSIIGHDVDFLYANIQQPSEPMACLLLTGYDYGTTVKAFVEFIEDLYDVEYGQTVRNGIPGIKMPLFQME